MTLQQMYLALFAGTLSVSLVVSALRHIMRR